jgi:hypothetical protein
MEIDRHGFEFVFVIFLSAIINIFSLGWSYSDTRILVVLSWRATPPNTSLVPTGTTPDATRCSKKVMQYLWDLHVCHIIYKCGIKLCWILTCEVSSLSVSSSTSMLVLCDWACCELQPTHIMSVMKAIIIPNHHLGSQVRQVSTLDQILQTSLVITLAIPVFLCYFFMASFFGHVFVLDSSFSLNVQIMRCIQQGKNLTAALCKFTQ